MNIRPEEVSSIIKKEIDNYKKSLEIKTSGTVLEVGDGIARIFGLSNVMSGELLEFPHGVMGMALNLEEDNVGAVILGNASLIKEGDEVRATGKVVSVPAGENLLGRVINALGEPIDGKGEIPREDVATVLKEIVTSNHFNHQEFQIISGDQDIKDALTQFENETD